MKKIFLTICVLFPLFLNAQTGTSAGTINYSASGIITTLAGNGNIGYSGDNILGTAAELYYPYEITVDKNGNIYIGDTYNYRVRKINTSGIISTIAGNGTFGYSGDGGPATAAQISYVYGLAVDRTGNIYFSDLYNFRIRKIDTNGIITTVAGNGSVGHSGDGGNATAASLYYPYGIAVDRNDNIYIADLYDNIIRKVDSNGIISTFAGNDTAGYSGDGGAATDAKLYYPYAVAADTSGNVYIADWYNNRIRKVNTSGIITTFAGSGTFGYAGDGAPATAASLYYPWDVATDSKGNVYISDEDNDRIRKVNAEGIISTAAGNGTFGYSGDGGLATNTGFYYPKGVCADALGNVYIADCYNQRIRKINSYVTSICVSSTTTLFDSVSGGGWSSSNSSVATIDATSGIVTGVHSGIDTLIYTVGGSSSKIALTVNPLPISGSISGGTAVCSGSNITLADTTSGGVWSVNNGFASVSSSVITGLIPGVSVVSYSVTNMCGTAVATHQVSVNTYPGIINGPQYLRVDSTILLSENVTGGIWSSSSAAIATVNATGSVHGRSAGTVTITYTKTGTCGTQRATHKIIVPSTSAYYVAQSISTYAGTGAYGDVGDNGPATSAKLYYSYCVATDLNGNIYIADNYYNRIRKVNSSGIISNFAGTGTPGFSGDGGPATAANLNFPCGIAVDASGNVYIADSYNCKIRKVSSSGVITSIAGNAILGLTWDGGPATNAELYYPYTIAVDGAGNVYFDDQSQNVIRKVNSAGIISTFAGTGNFGSGGDGGPATACELYYPWGVVADNSGNVYIADQYNHKVRKVDAGGVITTFAGSGAAIGFSGDGGAASAAGLYYPSVVSIDPSGNVYIADEYDDRIRKVTTDGIINTCAGSGTWGFSGDRGPATAADFYNPISVATDINGNFYVVDYNNFRIRKVGNQYFNIPAIIGNTSVCLGNSITLTDAVTGGVWSCSNTAKVSIDSVSGIATGIDTGTVTITYRYSGAYITQSLFVNNIYPSAIAGTPDVCTGNITSLTDATTGGTWSSGTTIVATVGTTGAVAGLTAGTTIITYTKTGCYVTQPVTVNTNPLAANTGPNAVCVGNTIILANSTSGGSWSSSHTAFATVDGSGHVTGIAIGVPVISYMLSSGCYKNTSVTVNNTYPDAIGGTFNVCSGNITTLSDSTTGGTWTSGTTTVATTGSTGTVTGITPGTAMITYTKTGCYVTQPVTVNANPLAANTGTMIVCTGNTTTLSNTTGGGAWASSNTANATVSSSTGIITGIVAGTPVITYTLGSGCYKTSTITVGAPITTAITGTASVCAGGSHTTLADATTGGTWTSGTTTIATIASTGIVTGVATGTSTITYTKTGCYVTQPVTVNTNPLAANTGTTAVCTGSTITLANSTSGGTWASSNTTDATVGSGTGIVSGATAGSLMITYTIGSGCYKTSNVSVHNPPSTISGSGAVCTSIRDTLTNTTSGGTWTSSATTKATVGATTGIVTGHSAGTATISYTVAGCSVATHPITVSVCRIGNIENSSSSTTTGTTNHYSIYPNPSNGIINIIQSIPDDIIADVKVMNYLGQAVYNGTVAFSGGSSQVYLEKVTPGIYMIELKEGKNKTETFRVIIEK